MTTFDDTVAKLMDGVAIDIPDAALAAAVAAADRDGCRGRGSCARRAVSAVVTSPLRERSASRVERSNQGERSELTRAAQPSLSDQPPHHLPRHLAD